MNGCHIMNSGTIIKVGIGCIVPMVVGIIVLIVEDRAIMEDIVVGTTVSCMVMVIITEAIISYTLLFNIQYSGMISLHIKYIYCILSLYIN